MKFFEEAQFLADCLVGRGMLWEQLANGEEIGKDDLVDYVRREVVGKNPLGDYSRTQCLGSKSDVELESGATALQVVGLIAHVANNLIQENQGSMGQKLWESLATLERIRINRGVVFGLNNVKRHWIGTEVSETVLGYLGDGLNDSEKTSLRYAIMINYCGKN